MSYTSDDFAQRVRQEAEAASDGLRRKRAEVAPVTTSDPDGLIAIEMNVDLEVVKVTVQPRATRDLDDLEALLATTITAAVKAAREADPALHQLDDLAGGAGVSARVDEMHAEVVDAVRNAQQRMEALRGRLEATRREAGRRA
jgi:DNA-binding protein YbaB